MKILFMILKNMSNNLNCWTKIMYSVTLLSTVGQIVFDDCLSLVGRRCRRRNRQNNNMVKV